MWLSEVVVTGTRKISLTCLLRANIFDPSDILPVDFTVHLSYLQPK